MRFRFFIVRTFLAQKVFGNVTRFSFGLGLAAVGDISYHIFQILASFSERRLIFSVETSSSMLFEGGAS